MIMIMGIVYMQFLMFILNAYLKLNLEFVQLYSPFMVLFIILFVGALNVYNSN